MFLVVVIFVFDVVVVKLRTHGHRVKTSEVGDVVVIVVVDIIVDFIDQKDVHEEIGGGGDGGKMEIDFVEFTEYELNHLPLLEDDGAILRDGGIGDLARPVRLTPIHTHA